MSTPGIMRERVTATLSVEMRSQSVDAGADLAVHIKVSCVPECDLEGEAVEIRIENGEVVSTAPLGAYDDDAGANFAELRLKAPLAPGDYSWSARLLAYEDDEVVYEAVEVPLAFTVVAHTTSMLVWDAPSAITAGESFRLKVGMKCSSGCRLAHRPFTVVDGDGQQIASAAVSEHIWPKSGALYFTELELEAPRTTGPLTLTVRCDETALRVEEGPEVPIPHTPGSYAVQLQCVRPPEFKVRIEAWDAELQTPLPGARVVLHPYQAVTDEQGVAELAVARGEYRLFVSRTRYTTFGTPVEIAADLRSRIALSREPPPNRE